MPYYRVVFEKFKLDKESRIALTKGFLGRSFSFASTIVFARSSPLYSTMPLLIIGIGGVFGAVFTRPFKSLYMTVIHFVFEGLLLATFLMTMIIGIGDNGNSYGGRDF